MPRIRTVKPQFWLDEKLGAVPREVRLLYIGLWNLCDDQGVFEYRPSRIKAQLFPYDNDIGGNEVSAWLDLLLATGDVIKFSENGVSFGYIPTFLKHQEIKNPSQRTFTHRYSGTRKDGKEYPSPTPVLPQDGVSPTPALPIGSRSLGSREEESIKKKKPPIVPLKKGATHTRRRKNHETLSGQELVEHTEAWLAKRRSAV